jgi:hypothetical protein
MGLIINPGKRVGTGFCLMCGADLIVPWNDYQCCSECTGRLEYHKKLAQRNSGKRNKGKKHAMMSKNVMRQRRRLGGIPE